MDNLAKTNYIYMSLSAHLKSGQWQRNACKKFCKINWFHELSVQIAEYHLELCNISKVQYDIQWFAQDAEKQYLENDVMFRFDRDLPFYSEDWCLSAARSFCGSPLSLRLPPSPSPFHGHLSGSLHPAWYSVVPFWWCHLEKEHLTIHKLKPEAFTKTKCGTSLLNDSCAKCHINKKKCWDSGKALSPAPLQICNAAYWIQHVHKKNWRFHHLRSGFFHGNEIFMNFVKATCNPKNILLSKDCIIVIFLQLYLPVFTDRIVTATYNKDPVGNSA